jgi:uncharacterized protein (TIGR03437 family)
MRRILLSVAWIVAFALGTSSLLLGQGGGLGYVVSTIGGASPIGLGDNGPATSALLYNPWGVTIDGSGNLFIADTSNHRIRKMTPAGVISTFAGAGIEYFGGDNGPATSAFLSFPSGVAVDPASGSVYIADRGNHRVRRVTTNGTISTVAGTGTAGFAGDGGLATAARLNLPADVTLDSAGNLYIADEANHRIRMVNPGGVISTVAGNGTAGFAGDNGPAVSAQLNTPRGVAVDSTGIYIADTNNNRVRKISLAGTIRTMAGTGTAGNLGENVTATDGRLNTPSGVAADGNGTVYIASSAAVRKVSPSGIITTIAGTGTPGFGGDGGAATAAQFDITFAGVVEVDSAGNLYVADRNNNRIRKITPSGQISTIAGSTQFAGDGGPATSATLFYPSGLAFDSPGNLYFADRENQRIRKITPAGVISTVAGTGGRGFGGDTGPATSALLNRPWGLAVDGAGNLYTVDALNNRIRKITPSGTISTIAGTGSAGFSGDGEQGTQAQINTAFADTDAVADASGNVYFTDTNNHRVRKVTSSGVISTVAGTGTAGFSGDGGPAVSAQLNAARGLALDTQGNLYIADINNHRVRKVNPSGAISTVAGNGLNAQSGDSGPALSAGLPMPREVAVDSSGNLYIRTFGPRIRKVTPAGVIYTVGGTGSAGFSGDGGLATLATFNGLQNFAVDSTGNVYLSDSLNHRIRKMTLLTPASLSLVSGNDQSGPIGRVLLNPLTVRVAGSGDIAVPGVTVTFAVTQGSATLSANAVVTGADGTASVDVTFGSTAGPVVVTASVSGAPTKAFSLTATAAAAGPPPPRISTGGGIIGGGLSIPAVRQISANSIISIFGTDFAPPGTARLVSSSDLVNGRLPTKLAGICVQVGSQLAPLFHVFPGQVNLQVPGIAGTGSVPVQVIQNCGESNEVKSNIVNVPSQPASPEFFFFIGNADGRNPIAATDAISGALIGAPGLIAGVTFVPAKPGDFLTIYATGLGATNPAFAAGELPDRAATAVLPVTVTLGQTELAAEDVLYAGLTSFAGLYQINIHIPAEVPDGNIPVTVQVGDFFTPVGGYVTVKR